MCESLDCAVRPAEVTRNSVSEESLELQMQILGLDCSSFLLLDFWTCPKLDVEETRIGCSVLELSPVAFPITEVL